VSGAAPGREGAVAPRDGSGSLSPFLRISAGIHAAAPLALFAWPQTWPWIVGTVLADHLTAVAAGLLPRSRLLGPNLRRITADPLGNGPRAVALTFDDGPDPEVTPRLLDILDRHGARATFFCIGDRVRVRPDVTREISARGHAVGNHGYTHGPGFFFRSPGGLRADLLRAQEEVAAATGRPPELFRAPAGIRGPWLQPVLDELGLDLVSWTRRGFDTVTPDPARVHDRLVKGLSPGDILVLHDGASARGPGGRPVVEEVLPRLLETISARGLATAALSGAWVRSRDRSRAGAPCGRIGV